MGYICTNYEPLRIKGTPTNPPNTYETKFISVFLFSHIICCLPSDRHQSEFLCFLLSWVFFKQNFITCAFVPEQIIFCGLPKSVLHICIGFVEVVSCIMKRICFLVHEYVLVTTTVTRWIIFLSPKNVISLSFGSNCPLPPLISQKLLTENSHYHYSLGKANLHPSEIPVHTYQNDQN